ncbi:MAG TPA: hypothetical protein VLF18_14320 [Tahibacter sp.]|uniref:hypothetical protein n=1 Tax=Tahibacter sp. TaxID=2056211 RepID=UPI002B79FAA4|nr:hypothetical protein [Tahibacter sp.]HSX61373.1 hypothetical protein [Tahibacter sp.]
MNGIRLLALAAALSAVGLAQGAEFSTLEERMSRAEFNAAGLDRLSPDQLKSLNDWLRIHGLAPGAPMRSATSRDGTPEFYPEEKERETIEANIQGRLDGWLGKTTFKLDNGQVWQQAESGMRTDLGLNSPAVRIKPMLLGSWLMYVDGCGCSLRVRRIK